MKHVDETRFQKKKPESIAFQGKTVPESTPLPEAPSASGAVRTNGRTDERTQTASNDLPAYMVRIPAERRKTRHPFDIFEDQLEGLRKIQLAERESSRPRRGKTLGEMAQEALDRFIAEKAKKLPNVAIRHEDAWAYDCIMNEYYNRQFLQIDFASLEAPEFFRFLQKAEFGACLILRRYVWRSTTPHQLGLHEYYWDKQLLVAAVENDLIARKMGIRDVTRVSKYHKSLEDFGVIQRLRTGRANIFILGEWIDISEGKDKSKRLEWFYFDRKFGGQHPHPEDGESDNGPDQEGREEGRNSDLAPNANSDLQKTPNQHAATWLQTPNQTWLNEPSHQLIDKQIDKRTVNGSKKNPIKALPAINQPEE